MPSAAVKVEGLNELIRAARKIELGMATEMTLTLKQQIGTPMSEDMKHMAEARGLVGETHHLVDMIKPTVRGASLSIRDTATNDGYPYPKRYEYQDGGARAFMEPVVHQWESSGELERRFDTYLDWIDKEWLI